MTHTHSAVEEDRSSGSEVICVFGSAGSVGTEEVLECGAKICVLNSERKWRERQDEDNIYREERWILVRAGVGPLFSPGVSDPRPDHFFWFTKQGWMQPALTGGAVNLSGGYHNYRKVSSFLYWSHFWDCLTILVLIRLERCKHSGLNCITVNASARSVQVKFCGHYLSAK